MERFELSLREKLELPEMPFYKTTRFLNCILVKFSLQIHDDMFVHTQTLCTTPQYITVFLTE